MHRDGKVQMERAVFYPDIVVANDDIGLDSDLVRSPVLIVEIVGSVAEKRHKWIRYQTIPTLLQYLLISHSEPLIEAYERRSGIWHYTCQRGLAEVISVYRPPATLPLLAIYGSGASMLDVGTEGDCR